MNLPSLKRQDGSFPISILGDFDKAFGEMFKMLDQSMHNYGYSPIKKGSAHFSPPLDVVKSDDGYRVSIDCPGVPKENINVSLDGNRLVIEGKKEEWKKEEKDEVVVSERYYGSFHRELALPEGVDHDSIDVSLKDGVLSINLASVGVTDTRRQIEIK